MMGSPPTPPPRYTPQAEPYDPASYPASYPPTSTLHPPRPIPYPTSQSSSTSSLVPSPSPNAAPWLTTDPRTSSTQSLLPPPPSSSSDARRKLLIIYIHGFLGNDQSFRSFPAHVHAMLSNLLSETHVIHSKIYPRYKTYRAIGVARDNFSQWLEPHEGPNTDVVLVGHSMGGILAADVILMPNKSPYGQYPFKHRILGHVSLDCPFLGLHPGIIISGISSLFKPSPGPPQNQLLHESSDVSDITSPASSSLNLTPHSSQSPSLTPSSSNPFPPPPTDPFFNAPFFNDMPLREQPFVRRMMHFAGKYKSEGLVQAAAKHVLSYLEYGSCLADPRELEIRYLQLRPLEDVDELQPFGPGKDPRGPQVRVRFVNYYTLCTGQPKSPKAETPKSEASQPSGTMYGTDDSALANTESMASLHLDPNSKDQPQSRGQSPRPSIQISNHDEDEERRASSVNIARDTKAQNAKDAETESIYFDMDNLSMHHVDPTPIDEVDDPLQSTPPQDADLPPIPDMPAAPTLPDLIKFTDKDSRKQAERESKRLQKAYDQALKDRAKALREREKLIEKRRKKAQKEAEKLEKADKRADRKDMERLEKEAVAEQHRMDKEKKRLEKEQRRADKEVEKQNMVKGREAFVAALEADRPKKLRKFCNLPNKVDGVRDRTWVDVFMPDVDEVGAHCGLFFPGPQYEKLVGDVGSRIMNWVHEDLTKRAILEMGQEVD